MLAGDFQFKVQTLEFRRCLPRYYHRQKLHCRGNPSTSYSIPARFMVIAVLPSSPLPCSSQTWTQRVWEHGNLSQSYGA